MSVQEKLLKKRPKRSEANEILSDVDLGVGSTDERLPELWELLSSGRYADALALGTEITREKPQEAWAWAGLGLAQASWEEGDAGVQSLRKAIEIEPARPDFYFLLGNVYREAENLSAAAREYKRALQIDDTLTEVRAALAICLGMTGDLGTAREMLERCVSEDPEELDYQDSLARVYVDLRHHGWRATPDGEHVYATERGQVEDGLAMLDKAERLQAEPELRQQIVEFRQGLRDLLKSTYRGKWSQFAVQVICMLVIAGFVGMPLSLAYYAAPALMFYGLSLPGYVYNKRVFGEPNFIDRLVMSAAEAAAGHAGKAGSGDTGNLTTDATSGVLRLLPGIALLLLMPAVGAYYSYRKYSESKDMNAAPSPAPATAPAV